MLQAGITLGPVNELTARDGLSREVEPDRGDFAATDLDLLRLGHGVAFADDFGLERVDVGRADFEFGRDQRATIGSRGRRGAVNDQASVSGEADDDGRGGIDRSLLRRSDRFALGHRFGRRCRTDGGGSAAVAAAMAATMEQAAEQAAVTAAGAAMAGGAALGLRAAGGSGAAVALCAAMAAIAEQTVTGAASTRLASRRHRLGTGAGHGCGATMAAIAAEIDRIIARRQGKHQNCGIHLSKPPAKKGSQPTQVKEPQKPGVMVARTEMPCLTRVFLQTDRQASRW